MYEKGRGVEKDAVQAVHWYRKAAEQGHVNAQHNLGCMYFSGDGVQQNDCEAARWWRMVVDQGEANAHYWLGQLAEQQGEYQAAIAHYRAGQAASGPEEARACIRRCVGAVVRAKQVEQNERIWGRTGELGQGGGERMVEREGRVHRKGSVEREGSVE
jgi:TPR repeat protein